METKKPEPAYRDLAGNEYQADQIPKSDDVEGTKKFQKNVAWRELAGVTADAKPEKMREIIEKHGKSEDPEIQAHYRELFPEFDQGRYARV